MILWLNDYTSPLRHAFRWNLSQTVVVGEWNFTKHWSFSCVAKDSKLQDFNDGDAWWTTKAIATCKEHGGVRSNPMTAIKFRKVSVVIQTVSPILYQMNSMDTWLKPNYSQKLTLFYFENTLALYITISSHSRCDAKRCILYSWNVTKPLKSVNLSLTRNALKPHEPMTHTTDGEPMNSLVRTEALKL